MKNMTTDHSDHSDHSDSAASKYKVEATENTNSPQRGLWLCALLTACAGIGTSIYSTLHHLELRANGHTLAACNINSAINCDAVAASKYSEVFQIPLGVWGLGYFIAMSLLSLSVFLNHKSAKEHEPTWFLLAAMGLLTSIILGSISLGVLGTVCLVCIAIYALTTVQAGLAWKMWSRRRGSLDFSLKTTYAGLTTAGIAVILTVLAFNFSKPVGVLPTEFQDTPGKHDAPTSLPPLASSPKEIPLNKNVYSGLGEDFRQGPDDAKIVIVEFADYMCPACGTTAPILEDLHKQLGNRALFVFKNFQLSKQCNASMQNDMHAFSCDIAKIARCAGSIGKFWEYHLKAYQEQTKASKEMAIEWGKGVGLTPKQMNECFASKDIQAKLLDDAALGEKLGVNATPTIFINGRQYQGDRSASAMRAAVEAL